MVDEQELKHQKLLAEIEEIRTRNEWQARKAESEIAELQKPWYRMPSVYAALSPVALAALGLLFSWASGWFDTQNTKLEAEHKLLEAQQTELRVETQHLQDAKVQLDEQVMVANAERDRLSVENTDLRSSIVSLTAERGRLAVERDDLQSKLDTTITTLQVNEAALKRASADAEAAQAQEAIVRIRAPITTAVDILRNDNMWMTSTSTRDLLRAACAPGAAERKFAIEQLRALAEDATASTAARAACWEILSDKTNGGRALTPLIKLAQDTADYDYIVALVDLPDSAAVWHVMDVASSRGCISVGTMSTMVTYLSLDMPCLRRGDEEESVVCRAINCARRVVLDSESDDYERIEAAQVIWHFSPFVASCALVTAVDESRSAAFQEMASDLVWPWVDGLFDSKGDPRRLLLSPSQGESTTMDALKRWVRAQDPVIVDAARYGSIDELLAGSCRSVLLIQAAE